MVMLPDDTLQFTEDEKYAGLSALGGTQLRCIYRVVIIHIAQHVFIECLLCASLVAQIVKNLSAIQETRV